MASFYPAKSKYYWVKYRDPISGKIKRHSLKILKTAQGLVEARREVGRLTDEDIRVVREELLNEPEWMQTCFEICLLTGCRRHESSIDFRDIDLERRLIRFVDPKGGPKRAFTIRFTAALLPVLQRLKDKGYKKTLEFPEKHRSWKMTGTNHFPRFFARVRPRLISTECA